MESEVTLTNDEENHSNYHEVVTPMPRPCRVELELFQFAALLLPCFTKAPGSETDGQPSELYS